MKNLFLTLALLLSAGLVEAQLKVRFQVSKSLNGYSCVSKYSGIDDYSRTMPTSQIYVHQEYSGNESYDYTPDFSTGLGFFYTKNKLSLELSPSLIVGNYLPQISRADSYSYFHDASYQTPLSESEIISLGLSQGGTSNSDLLSLRRGNANIRVGLGFQLNSKNCIRLFISQNYMTKSQFGQVYTWSPSNGRLIAFHNAPGPEGTSYIPVYAPLTSGLSFERKIKEYYVLTVFSSTMVKAFDEDFKNYLYPIKRSVSFGFQIAYEFHKSSKKKTGESNKSKGNPTVL